MLKNIIFGMLVLLIFPEVLCQNICGMQEMVPRPESGNKSPKYAPLGGDFTAKGKMRILIISAGFTNDANTVNNSNSFWPYDDGSGTGNSLPKYDQVLYSQDNQFDISNSDNSLSNFYLQMSKHAPNPFELTYELFPVRINVPVTQFDVDQAYQSSGSVIPSLAYRRLNQKVMDIIKNDYPDAYNWANVDQRKNNPNYTSDNSLSSPDRNIDYVLITWRFDDANDPIGVTGLAGISSNGVASTLLNDTIVTSTNDSFFVNTGFSLYTGMHDPSFQKEYFLHEIAHQFYDCPHNFAANNTHGNHFTTNYGWGMLTEDLKQLYCANAWERWYVGWIDIKHDFKNFSGSDNGIYYLEDYVSSGDAIRIEIPHTNGKQHLWLENHQGKNSTFDNRLRYNPSGNNGFTAAPRGLLAYVEDCRPSRDSLPGVFANSNGMKVLSAQGNYDYTPTSTVPTSAIHYFGTSTIELETQDQNPFQGGSLVNKIRADYNNGPDGKIIYNPGGNGGYNESVRPLIIDGANTFDILGTNIGFNPGDKIGIGSNPSATNYLHYWATDTTADTTYLNGISIEVLSVNSTTKEMQLRIKFNDTKIDNDTRYTGKIILKDVPSAPNGIDLDIAPYTQLHIDKSKSPNRHLERSPSSGDFVNPTTFTVYENAFMHIDHHAKVIVENESTFHLNKLSKLEVHEHAELRIKSGCKLIIENLANLIVHRDGKVIIEDGAELILKNNHLTHGLMIGNNTTNYQTAELQIHGTLRVDDGASLANIGDGFISFYGNGKLEFGDNTSVRLLGDNRNDELLKLGSNVQLEMDAESINIQHCLISLAQNATISFNKNKQVQGIHPNCIFQDIQIDGVFTGRNNELVGYQLGDVSASNCNLSNMKTGLNLINPKGWVVVSHGNFTGCETGLQISGAIDPTNKIQNSTFNNCTVGMNLLGCPAITTSLAEFDNCATGIKTNGTTYLYLENRTKVRNGNIGVKADLTNVFVRETSQISGNNIGVEMINSPIKPKIFSMGDDGTCGWLTNNGVGLAGKNIALDVDAIDRDPTTTNFIPNHFEGNGVMFNYLLEAAGGITSLPKISMKGNYWGSPTIVGSINNPIYKAYIPNHQIQIYYESAIGQILRYNVDYSSPCARGSSNCTICNDLIAAPPGGGGRPNITPIEQILSSCYKTDQPGGGNGNGETIKEEFNRGYNKFLAKDYDAAIPMLEEVAEIPFRERQPRLNDHCEHLILIAEILTEKFTNGDVVGNLTSNPYKLEINPNPVHGNFVANFDMLDKANGKLVIKDAITGLEVQSESLANASGSKQININGLQSGNYILELHGNNQFLKSQHLMVY